MLAPASRYAKPWVPGILISLLLGGTGGLATRVLAQADPAGISAVPSGMDLLYSDRLPFLPSGEPVVALGLMSGQARVRLRGDGPLQVALWQRSLLKAAVVQPGDELLVAVRRAHPAAKQHYVDLEGIGWGDKQKLAATLTRWRERGFKQVETVEEGTILGIGGRILDNREYRVILPVSNAERAAALAARVFERFGTSATTGVRLLERPWAYLAVSAGGMPLGEATSFVRVTAKLGHLVTVKGVEHGVGYPWHGREDRAYRGEVYVVVDPNGKLAVVNVLGAEAILAGVVPSELFAVAPPEALKAQAVAARNHLLAKLGRRHHADPFHLCAEQHCQVYAGTSREDPRTSAAVEGTVGEALFLRDHLVHAVYSSSCGGHTEDNDTVWGQRPDPALRGRPDFDLAAHPELEPFADGLSPGELPAWLNHQVPSYCSENAHVRLDRFRWRVGLTAEKLHRLLRPRYRRLGRLRNIQPQKRGPGGRIASLKLIGEHGEATILGELAIRRLFGGLNSGAFVVEEHIDERDVLTHVTFRGAGWGHGVGMCQLGTVGRAEAGHDYHRILSHYYGGAQVRRLYGGR